MLLVVKMKEDLWGKDGGITQMNKAILERILNVEMDFHQLKDPNLRRIAGNSRKGHCKKKVSGNFDEIEIQTSRDRQRCSNPKLSLNAPQS